MDKKVIPVPVEGHSKWLFDLAPYMVERAKPQNEYEDSFCTKLLKKNEDEMATDIGWNEWSINLAHKMNSIAISILTLDKQDGKNQRLMDELDEQLLKYLRPATDNQREVLFYCKSVLKWRSAGGKDGDETAKRLNQKWEAMVNEGGNEVKATVAFLKGRMAMELGMELEKVRDFYLEAIELDSECVAWYNQAYLVVREIRRDEGGPSKMEQDLAETAFKISFGQNIIAAANYAIMCKEVWMEKREHFWGDDPEMYFKCVKYLENAMQFAEGDWLMKIRIHLAEFLYFGKGTEKDVLRGLNLFLALERIYPGRVSARHMAGKRYFELGNFQRARKSYELALEQNPVNVPCVMDYIQLLNLKIGEADRNDILRILRRALSSKCWKSDKDIATLQAQLVLVMKEIHGGSDEDEDGKD